MHIISILLEISILVYFSISWPMSLIHTRYIAFLAHGTLCIYIVVNSVAYEALLPDSNPSFATVGKLIFLT